MRNQNLFEGARMTLDQATDLTVQSLCAYGDRYDHWAIAYSGGKDSTATVTAVAELIQQERVPRPKSLTVLYADTRMELPPLQLAAMQIMKILALRDIETRVVLPPIDERFFVYMFGRGVPPPKNRFRWCTSQIKVEPMITALKSLREEAGEKLLMITGVRLGESTARDQRIVMSCSRDGAECGQGWFQQSTPESVADTLAPLLHWRVCHISDWLEFFAPEAGYPTLDVLNVYHVGEEGSPIEIAGRTGCIGCNLASNDHILDRLLKRERWAYLAPFKHLRPLYQELTKPQWRLRKGMETRIDGSLVANPGRLGPLTMDARRFGLRTVLSIQDGINLEAKIQGRPEVSLINFEERTRIEELIAANTWPNRWSGDEQVGDVWADRVMRDGSVQAILPALV
jgi:DNA sulfur modification protein DndC